MIIIACGSHISANPRWNIRLYVVTLQLLLLKFCNTPGRVYSYLVLPLNPFYPLNKTQRSHPSQVYSHLTGYGPSYDRICPCPLHSLRQYSCIGYKKIRKMLSHKVGNSYYHHGRGRFLVHRNQFLTDSDTRGFDPRLRHRIGSFAGFASDIRRQKTNLRQESHN